MVTVVIPNYNGIRFLKDCLDSVLNQNTNTPEYEVLIVDNGSTDGSVPLIEEQYPQVRIERLPDNTGFCHAVNVGIQKATYPYVILLNNDTRVKKDFINALYQAILSKPQAFSVSAKMLAWDNPELLDDAGDRYCALGWAYARGKGKPAAFYGESCEIFSSCGGAAIYKKELLRKIGLFDEAHFAYLEDLDICYRARIYGYRSYYEPGAEVIHYGSASSGSRYNEWKTSLASANNIYVIGKNMPVLQIVWNLPLLFIGFLIKYLFFVNKRMGMVYLRGIGTGFRKVFSSVGRKNKVPFRIEHLGNYLSIQWQLYRNLIHFLKKS